jgi:hypothetical protein
MRELVVEDEPMIARFIAKGLGEAGYADEVGSLSCSSLPSDATMRRVVWHRLASVGRPRPQRRVLPLLGLVMLLLASCARSRTGAPPDTLG